MAVCKSGSILAVLVLVMASASCTPASKPTTTVAPRSPTTKPELPTERASENGAVTLPASLGHDDFATYQALAVTRPATGLLSVAFVRVLAERTFDIHPKPIREYRAIPLAAFLEARAKELQEQRPQQSLGAGEHLTITNLRGEQLYLTRTDIAKYEPMIVIGIDGEENLFRIFTSYRLKREYTWRDAEGSPGEAPPTMIRPVGPFLFFPKGEPPEIEDTTLAGFCLTPSSFHFTKDDSLASIRSFSPELRQALAGRDGCLKCHSFHGAGARAHHVRASDGKAHGGFALPLEEYPREVLHRFLFDQDTVASSFGVDPLHIDEPTAKVLFSQITSKSK